MRIWVFLTFLLSVNFGQIIYHQPVHTARAGNDLSIEAIIDEGGLGLIKHIYFSEHLINLILFI